MKNKIIIGVSLLLLLVIGITYAWFTWNSEENTNVSVTIEGMNITYEDGEDITGINLIPVSTKEKGELDGTAIAKEITVSSNMNAYLDLNMNLEILPEGLKDASFKWEIYKGEETLLLFDYGWVRGKDESLL